jgi:hypothetical protein
MFFREKKREREREELWKRLHELADEIQKSDKHGTPSLPSSSAAATGQSTNSDGTLNSTSSNQNNTQAASSAQSHSAISTQMNSMSISGAAAMSK